MVVRRRNSRDRKLSVGAGLYLFLPARELCAHGHVRLRDRSMLRIFNDAADNTEDAGGLTERDA